MDKTMPDRLPETYAESRRCAPRVSFNRAANPDINREGLELTMSFASSEPYPRYDYEVGRYDEILEISEKAIDLARLNGGASVLHNHNPDKIVGTVIKAWLEDGKLHARVRFRKNDPESVNLFNDIADGTVRNVSIGYVQDVIEFSKSGEKTIGRVTRWTPYEVSVAVGIPADPTVGLYRNATKKGKVIMAKNTEEEIKNTEEEVKNTETEETKNTETEEDAAEKKKAAAPAGRAAEIGEIRAMCEALNRPELARTAILENIGPAAVRQLLKEDMTRESASKPPAGRGVQPQAFGIGKSRAEREYNIGRVLRSMIDPRHEAGFEREVSDELYRQCGIAPDGNSVMLDLRHFVPQEFRAANASGASREFDAAAGPGLIGTDHMPNMFVWMLRKRTAFTPHIMSGLVGNVSIPAQTAGGTAAWTGNLNADVTETAPEVGNILLTPKKLGCFTVVGKDLITQGTPDAVNLVITDIMDAIGALFDRTVLKGDATAGIIGIEGTTGVQTIDIADIAASEWRDWLKFSGAIGDYTNTGTPVFVMRSADRAELMGRPKDAGSGRFICEDGRINGDAVRVSGNIDVGDVSYGDHSKIIAGFWGGLEITLDPYTFVRSQRVQVVANAIADLAIRNPEAFVIRARD